MTPDSLTFAFAFAALAAWFWYASSRAREIGTRAAMETCQRQATQFLDGTVALQRLRLARDARGRIGLQRTYQFEYSEDHDDRQRGFIIMSGFRVESIGLAPLAADGRQLDPRPRNGAGD